MQRHTIIGGDGVELNVVETGNPAGLPLLFIHGFTQSYLTWSKQLDSDLADDFRLVAMDIRGHGASSKPSGPEPYMDSKLWADDLNAVISGLGLEQAVVVGWSYGPLIILDYIRHYGEASVGGIQFVGGITKLGSEEATGYLTPAILALVPGLFSTNADESNKALRSLVHLFFFDEPSSDDVDLMVRYESDVPPYVRQALFSRSLDNDDVLAKLSKPLVITHSVDDRIVFPSAADQIASVVPHAQIDKLSGVGHAPFWEDAAGFNARLREFALSMSDEAQDAPAGAAA